jgi:hypothetical protein
MKATRRWIARPLLFAGLGLIAFATASSTPAQIFTTGECNRYKVDSIVWFDCGADSCFGLGGSCKDQNWTYYVYTPGTCVGAEPDCVLFTQPVIEQYYADCECQSDGRTCALKELKTQGSTGVQDCVNP